MNVIENSRRNLDPIFFHEQKKQNRIDRLK